MGSTVQIFKNEEFGEVRTIVDENNEALFALVDVAKALGYKRPSDAVASHCKSGNTVIRRVAHSTGVS